MSARPQNIGIKAIEVYFPSQVSVADVFQLLPLRFSILILLFRL